jgi:heavy metal sensor kinase
VLAEVPAGTVAVAFDPVNGSFVSTPTGARTATTAQLEAIPWDATADTVQTVRLPGGDEWRVVTMPVRPADGSQWQLRVARSDRDVELALRQLLVRMALAVPLVLLLAVGGGVFLAGRALDPIDHIRQTAEAIGAENLGRRLGLRGNDELSRLAATFDSMLDRLAQAFERQRQFTADASHELRTPLAMLMSEIDIALERRRCVDDYEAVLHSMREDVAQLSQLVSELLMLARAEAGQEPLARETLDLAVLASGVAASMEPLARARDIHLVYAGDRPVLLEGDETRLTQLLVNVVDNAIKYTPPGGNVRVAVGEDASSAVVNVEDTGDGIAPEHLPRIFERFYRADTARSRGAGAGLGLAISRWIAQAHGGEITISSVAGRGTTVVVHLPKLRTDASSSSRSNGLSRTRTDAELGYAAGGHG